jgi:serine/threonine protein kinase
VNTSSDDLTGRQLGTYRIESLVGAGGMAAVYKAYQASMDRYVAVKVLPRAMAVDPQFTSRFENEARLLARLQHPHILPVFDFGQAEGYAYFVMPLVETGTLAQRLHAQPLPLDQLRKFVSQIGDALDYAHSRGLLHRDVKPSNVLVDERDNYLLTDFGIAKLVDGPSNLTATGTLIGTPAYMSPEQGQGRNLDRRSDIYSLGVIVYELATGRVPFTADTPVAVIFKHVSDPLPPVEALNPDLPPALVQAIYKSLAKWPDERFQTGREMVDAIEAAIDVEPEPRVLAATLLEPSTPVTTTPVYSPPTAAPALPSAVRSPTQGPQTSRPSLAGGTASAPPLPARRNWLGAALGLGGVGVVGLVGLAVVACLAAYVFFPQVFGLPAKPAATRTAEPVSATATARPTRAPTDIADTAEPDEPTATPRPTRTPRPAEPTEIVVVVDDSAYSDDFEDSSSGWDESEDDSATVGYVDGEYSIGLTEASTFMSSLAPAGEFTDVHLGVTVYAVDNPEDAPAMGLLCAVQDSGAYYELGFSADGYYGIAYYDGEEVTFLTNDKNEWSPTAYIEKFADSYYLEADCNSDGTLTLSVDGVEVASVQDRTLSAGEVGLFGASFDEVPVEVRFDDLEVTAAEAPEELFSDDFDAGGNWWTGSNADHAIAYVDGQYVIAVYSKELLAYGNPEINVGDAHLSVTVWNEAGTTEVGFGLICNYQTDTNEYYYLGVGSDGYYAIGFYDGEKVNVLTTDDDTWTKSDAITVGQTQYQLDADCGGDGTLRLIVDGVEIAAVTDDRYTSGDIGLFVETWVKVPVEIKFDDVTVTALE